MGARRLACRVGAGRASAGAPLAGRLLTGRGPPLPPAAGGLPCRRAAPQCGAPARGGESGRSAWHSGPGLAAAAPKQRRRSRCIWGAACSDTRAAKVQYGSKQCHGGRGKNNSGPGSTHLVPFQGALLQEGLHQPEGGRHAGGASGCQEASSERGATGLQLQLRLLPAAAPPCRCRSALLLSLATTPPIPSPPLRLLTCRARPGCAAPLPLTPHTPAQSAAPSAHQGRRAMCSTHVGAESAVAAPPAAAGGRVAGDAHPDMQGPHQQPPPARSMMHPRAQQSL